MTLHCSNPSCAREAGPGQACDDCERPLCPGCDAARGGLCTRCAIARAKRQGLPEASVWL